jgi:hypothetical protein
MKRSVLQKMYVNLPSKIIYIISSRALLEIFLNLNLDQQCNKMLLATVSHFHPDSSKHTSLLSYSMNYSLKSFMFYSELVNWKANLLRNYVRDEIKSINDLD